MSVFALAAGLAAIDLAIKGIAERALTTTSVNLWLLHLRLAHNQGVAFSLGSSLPGWVILIPTAALTVGLGVYLWRGTPTSSRQASLALSAVLAGAVANLLDRTGDGVVTDYIHTGWWPTFNLADALIVTGGGLALLSLRPAPNVDGESPAPTMLS